MDVFAWLRRLLYHDAGGHAVTRRRITHQYREIYRGTAEVSDFMSTDPPRACGDVENKVKCQHCGKMVILLPTGLLRRHSMRTISGPCLGGNREYVEIPPGHVEIAIPGNDYAHIRLSGWKNASTLCGLNEMSEPRTPAMKAICPGCRAVAEGMTQ